MTQEEAPPAYDRIAHYPAEIGRLVRCSRTENRGRGEAGKEGCGSKNNTAAWRLCTLLAFLVLGLALVIFIAFQTFSNKDMERNIEKNSELAAVQTVHLHQQIATLRDQLASQQTALADLSAQHQGLAANVRQVAQSMEQLEQLVEEMAGSLGSLKSEVATVDGKLAQSATYGQQLIRRLHMVQEQLHSLNLTLPDGLIVSPAKSGGGVVGGELNGGEGLLILPGRGGAASSSSTMSMSSSFIFFLMLCLLILGVSFD